MKIKPFLFFLVLLACVHSLHAQKLKVSKPYIPLQISETNEISLLGRKMELDKNGFPKQLKTFDKEDLKGYSETSNNLLYENIHFHFVRKSDGKNLKLTDQGITFTKKDPAMAKWIANSVSDSLNIEVVGTLAYDGFLSYVVKVAALQDMTFKDVTMHIPFNKTAANEIEVSGMARGALPEKVEVKWDGSPKNADGVWVGNPNAGLQLSLSDEQYHAPLTSNFGAKKQQLRPTSWTNNGNGGMTIGIKGSSMLVNSYTGPLEMKKGEVLYLNFNLLLTPMHQ